MRLVKTVSLGLPLSRAAAHLPPPNQRAEPGEFSRWWAQVPLRPASCTTDHARVLLAGVPTTDPMGAAYHDGLLAAIALAEEDRWRSFDVVCDLDPTLVGQLTELADLVEDRSPLLQPVADLLHQMAPEGEVELAFVDTVRDRLTGPALGVGTLTYDDAYRGPVAHVSWNDLELLLPGIRDQVADITEALYAGVPTGCDDDSAVRHGRTTG